MALYKVTDRNDPDKPRLVKATSGPAALKHVASAQYAVETMDNPTAVAELMDAGVRLETAGADVEQVPEPSGETGGGSQESGAPKA